MKELQGNTYNDLEKEVICDIVYTWLRAHECWGGEMASQDDNCTIDAIDLVCDLADIKDVTD